MKPLTTIIGACLLILPAHAATRRPNLVICVADDWGWPHAPGYGDKTIHTPNFDRIARQGVLFEQAYVSAPSCTPSRNAILTGKYHWALGVGANLWSRYPDGQPSYPRELEKAGYFVGSYRKSFGPGKDETPPSAGKVFRSPGQFFKQRPKDRPFCFWFGSSDPHRGYQKGSGKQSGIDLAGIQVPPMLPDTPEVRSDIADYYFEVQRFDREVGELLDLLEQEGELANTLLFVTGDNGWPFPRGKSNLYDLGTREPLAAMWPAGIRQPGRRFDGFVSLIDLTATFYDAAGVPQPPGLHGQSLKGLLENSPDFHPREFVLTGKERHTPCQNESMEGYPSRALRNRRFLYIRNFLPDLWPAGVEHGDLRENFADIDDGPTKTALLSRRGTPDGDRMFQWCCGKRPAEELYDCAKDPFQLHNLADDPSYQNDLAGLRKQLESELRKTGDLRVEGRGTEYSKFPYLGTARH